ncbi:unnamed protein product [Mytilus edulis]|uniref:Uncharacterized protein n=1 Tax=Mytilus edulis TaxID=6550 RepID=A0A8S3RR70_MYTED|nr:unnamed protein product [Mytilus edulis]
MVLNIFLFTYLLGLNVLNEGSNSPTYDDKIYIIAGVVFGDTTPHIIGKSLKPYDWMIYTPKLTSPRFRKTTRLTRTTISSTHSTYSDTKKTIITDYILGFGIPLAVVIACFATVVLKAKCNDMTRVKRKTYADMVLQKSSAPPVTNEIPEYDNACLCLHQFDTVPYRQRAGQPNETDTNDIVDRNAAICQDGYATKTALFSSAENVNETSEPPENLATVDLPTYEEPRFLSNCLYETSLILLQLGFTYKTFLLDIVSEAATAPMSTLLSQVNIYRNTFIPQCHLIVFASYVELFSCLH